MRCVNLQGTSYKSVTIYSDWSGFFRYPRPRESTQPKRVQNLILAKKEVLI